MSTHLIICGQLPAAANATRARAVIDALVQRGRVVVYELGQSQPKYSEESRQRAVEWLSDRNVRVVRGMPGDSVASRLREAMDQHNGARPFDVAYAWHFRYPPLVFPSVAKTMPDAVRICDADVLPGRLKDQIARASEDFIDEEGLASRRQDWNQVLAGLVADSGSHQIWLSSPIEANIFRRSLLRRANATGRRAPNVAVVALPTPTVARPLPYAQRKLQGELTGNYRDPQNIYSLLALNKVVPLLPEEFRCELIGPNLKAALATVVPGGVLDSRFRPHGFVSDETLDQLVSTSMFSFSLGPTIGIPQKILYASARGSVPVTTARTAYAHGFGADEAIVASSDIHELEKRLVYAMTHEDDWTRLSQGAVRLSSRYGARAFDESIDAALAQAIAERDRPNELSVSSLTNT